MTKTELEKQVLRLREFARLVIEESWSNSPLEAEAIHDIAIDLELIELYGSQDDENDNEVYVFTDTIMGDI